MTLKDIVVTEYQAVILESDIPSELKRALKYHERVPQFIDNLVKELYPIKGLKAETIRSATKSLTLLWIRMVKQKADEKYLSDVERHRIIKEQDDVKLLREYTDKVLESGNESIERTQKGETTRSTYKI